MWWLFKPHSRANNYFLPSFFSFILDGKIIRTWNPHIKLIKLTLLKVLRLFIYVRLSTCIYQVNFELVFFFFFFEFSFKAFCGGPLYNVSNNTQVTLSSAYLPLYPYELSCRWEISTNQNHQILLGVIYYYNEGKGDVLSIADKPNMKNSILLTRRNTMIPAVITSRGSSLSVVFDSNGIRYDTDFAFDVLNIAQNEGQSNAWSEFIYYLSRSSCVFPSFHKNFLSNMSLP